MAQVIPRDKSYLPALPAAACPSLCVISHLDENKGKKKNKRSQNSAHSTRLVWLAILTLRLRKQNEESVSGSARVAARIIASVLAEGKNTFVLINSQNCKNARSLIESSL